MPINVRDTEDTLQLIDAGLVIAQEQNVRMTAEQLLIEGFVATEAEKGMQYVKTFSDEIIHDLEKRIRDFLSNPKAPFGFKFGHTYFSVQKGSSADQWFICAGKHWEYTIAMAKMGRKRLEHPENLLIYIEEENAYNPNGVIFERGRDQFSLVKFYEPAEMIKAMIGLYSSGQWNKEM